MHKKILNVFFYGVLATSFSFDVFAQRYWRDNSASLEHVKLKKLVVGRCFKGGQDDDVTHLNRGGKLLFLLFGSVMTAEIATISVSGVDGIIVLSDEKKKLTIFKNLLLVIDELSEDMNGQKEKGCVRVKKLRVLLNETDK